LNSIQEPFLSLLLLVARIGLSTVFLVSGVHKALWHAKAIEEFKLASVPLIQITLPLTIILHFVASVCILFGFFVAEAAMSLFVFTIVATLWVFPFWRHSGEERLIQSRIALANFGLAGGLLLLIVSGTGHYALFL